MVKSLELLTTLVQIEETPEGCLESGLPMAVVLLRVLLVRGVKKLAPANVESHDPNPTTEKRL